MYEAKRRITATGIARTGLPLRRAALGLLVDWEPLAPVAVPDPEVEAGKRVELTTAEVGVKVTFVVPCWTVMYMPCEDSKGEIPIKSRTEWVKRPLVGHNNKNSPRGARRASFPEHGEKKSVSISVVCISVFKAVTGHTDT